MRALGLSLSRTAMAEQGRLLVAYQSNDWDNFTLKFQGLRRFKQLDDKEVADYLENPNYFATLMLATSQADAIVSGATSTASSALRPLLQIIPRYKKAANISSLNIFDLDNPERTG